MGDPSPEGTDPMQPAADPAFHSHDHAHCAGHILDRAEALAREAGLRFTPVRRRTLEILSEQHRAMGAYDVLERLVADGFANQPPVAYRALEFLETLGVVHRIRGMNAYTACAAPGTDHAPVFLICRVCHAVAEAPAAPVLQALDGAAATLGFVVERATVEATGLCPACRAAA